ncbi:Retrovirus-related Pol polyprotein from transposon RE1 (Retro element 1) (AtRE1) [Includes: Protease RE1 [Durusdinium trenchii]|uniref:Retrovirus-related Pol polyprotein from transposon RE1 (Retro element 1) (AtRE1) n=1 Tax=Durusdinium trenchii TaxID=1381693 RepID=A0ABP0J9A4_9DINO
MSSATSADEQDLTTPTKEGALQESASGGNTLSASNLGQGTASSGNTPSASNLGQGTASGGNTPSASNPSALSTSSSSSAEMKAIADNLQELKTISAQLINAQTVSNNAGANVPYPTDQVGTLTFLGADPQKENHAAKAMASLGALPSPRRDDGSVMSANAWRSEVLAQAGGKIPRIKLWIDAATRLIGSTTPRFRMNFTLQEDRTMFTLLEPVAAALGDRMLARNHNEHMCGILALRNILDAFPASTVPERATLNKKVAKIGDRALAFYRADGKSWASIANSHISAVETAIRSAFDATGAKRQDMTTWISTLWEMGLFPLLTDANFADSPQIRAIAELTMEKFDATAARAAIVQQAQWLDSTGRSLPADCLPAVQNAPTPPAPSGVGHTQQRGQANQVCDACGGPHAHWECTARSNMAPCTRCFKPQSHLPSMCRAKLPSAEGCLRCGSSQHVLEQCTVDGLANAVCPRCNRKGHAVSACRAKNSEMAVKSTLSMKHHSNRYPALAFSIDECPTNESLLLIDSCASVSMTGEPTRLHNVTTTTNAPDLHGVSGTVQPSERGNLNIDLGGTTHTIPRVFVVPHLGNRTVIAANDLHELGLGAHLAGTHGSYIFSLEKPEVPVAALLHNNSRVYQLANGTGDVSHDESCLPALTKADIHIANGHVTPATGIRGQVDAVENLEIIENGSGEGSCDTCAMTKQRIFKRTRHPMERATAPKRLFHIDAMGDRDVSIDGYHRAVVAVDDFSGFTYVYLQRIGDTKAQILPSFVRDAFGPDGIPPSGAVIRADKAFTQGAFADRAEAMGFTFDRIIPHEHVTNAVAERTIGLLGESVRAILHGSNLPASYWTFALRTAVHASRLRPSARSAPETPWEKDQRGKPTFDSVPFGVAAYARKPKDQIAKRSFDTVSRVGINLGPTPLNDSSGFNILLLDTGRIVVRRSVVFNTRIYPAIGDCPKKIRNAARNLFITAPGAQVDTHDWYDDVHALDSDDDASPTSNSPGLAPESAPQQAPANGQPPAHAPATPGATSPTTPASGTPRTPPSTSPDATAETPSPAQPGSPWSLPSASTPARPSRLSWTCTFGGEDEFPPLTPATVRSQRPETVTPPGKEAPPATSHDQEAPPSTSHDQEAHHPAPKRRPASAPRAAPPEVRRGPADDPPQAERHPAVPPTMEEAHQTAGHELSYKGHDYGKGMQPAIDPQGKDAELLIVDQPRRPGSKAKTEAIATGQPQPSNTSLAYAAVQNAEREHLGLHKEARVPEITFPGKDGKAAIEDEDFSDIKVYDEWAATDPVEVPSSYADIANLRPRDRDLWQRSCLNEWHGLITNETFAVVDESEPKRAGIRPIGTKFIMTKKQGDNRLKSRCVAKGYQDTGNSYVDTESWFAPTISMPIIWLVTIISLTLGLECRAIDISQAYLQSPVYSFSCYFTPPKGISDFPKGKVLKALKPLYGLSCAGSLFYQFTVDFFTRNGWKQSKWHPCLLFKPGENPGDKPSFCTVFVDDYRVYATSGEIDRLKAQITEAGMKFTEDSGSSFSLGHDWDYDPDAKTCTVGLETYARKLLDKYKIHATRSKTTPAPPEATLPEAAEGSHDPRYSTIVGELLYLARVRPDIAFVASMLARHMKRNDERHYQRAVDVLKYVANDPGRRITLRGADGVEDLKLFAATDASWAACRNSGRSTSGGALGLGTSFFMFVSHLQSSVATSSAEAEVYGISDRVNDIIYYRAIMDELGLDDTVLEPTPIYVDAQAAMKMIQRPMATNKSKHIGTRLFRIKELVDDRVVSLVWVSTDDQPSDCLTKSLTGPKLAVNSALLFDGWKPKRASELVVERTGAGTWRASASTLKRRV